MIPEELSLKIMQSLISWNLQAIHDMASTDAAVSFNPKSFDISRFENSIKMLEEYQ